MNIQKKPLAETLLLSTHKSGIRGQIGIFQNVSYLETQVIDPLCEAESVLKDGYVTKIGTKSLET